MGFKRPRQGDAAGNPRTKTVGCSASEPEKAEIEAGLGEIVHANQSESVRLVLLTVARNPAVREVLLSHLPKAA